METVTTNVEILVQFIGYSVEICIVWHGCMERIVEHAHLWSAGHQGIYRTNTAQMSRIVYGSKVAKAFYSRLYLLIHDDTLLI